jgi:peptidoglycan/LPS O-acetylase OafA/YrhL
MPFILSQFIEACRWVGALVVLAVHATNMFVSLADIMSAPHSAPVYAWWFFASFELGHQAVLGFFVMSGYLVGGGVIAHIRKNQDFLREYLIHRFSRIYLVVAPAVFLTLVVDSLGRSLFADSGVYDWPMFKGHFTAPLFFGSLANLQGIVTDYFGTNGPLWSLACEFWYYITFPLLLMPLARNYSPLVRFGGFALGLALVAALSIPQSWFKFGYILWVMGAAATLAPRPLIKSRWIALAIYTVAVVLIRLLVRGPNLVAFPWLMDAADIVGSALFIVVILSFRFGPHEGFALFRPKIHKTLADFSFSLYSIHMPLLILARAAAGHFFGPGWAQQLATPQHWATMAAVMTATVGAAYVFSRFTEARTGAARRVLRRFFDRIAPAESASAEQTAPAPSRVSTRS